MIGIKIGENSLVLPRDLRLRFELVNSAFDFDTIPAGLVWNFDLPAEENANVLDYAHFIDIKTKRRAYDATVIINGKEIIGKLVTQKTGSVRYSCSFIINGFPVDALEQKLPELFTDGVSFQAAEIYETMKDHANSTVTQTWPAVNYNFPMYKNTVFYGSENPTFQDIVNAWNQGTQSFEVNDINEVNYNEFSLSPWLYLCYVVKTTFEALGYTATGSFFQDELMKKVLLYNNYALDRLNEFFRGSFAGSETFDLPMPNDSAVIPIDDVVTPPNTDPNGLLDVITHEYTVDEAGWYRISANIVMSVNSGNPLDAAFELYLDSVFYDGILNDPYLNGPYEFQVADIGKKLTLRVVTQSSNNVTVTAAMLYILKGHSPKHNIYAREINYRNHVPDIAVRDFIVALRKFPGLRIDFNPAGKTVELDFVKNIFTAKIDNWTENAAKHYDVDTNDGSGITLGWNFDGDAQNDDNFIDLTSFIKVGDYATSDDLPEPTGLNYYALVLNTNKIYIVVYNVSNDLEWQLLCDNYYDRVVGDGATEIRSDFSPMLMSGLNTVIIPQIEQTGSAPAFTTGINAFPLKLAIWHGLQAGFGGDYPLASSCNRDYNGDMIGDYTLRFDDEDYGLYVTFWQKWIEFTMATETIVRSFQHSVNEVFGWLFSRKKRVQHVEYVVKKVTVEAGAEGLEEAEVEHCKIL